jgi:hypothetical protein
MMYKLQREELLNYTESNFIPALRYTWISLPEGSDGHMTIKKQNIYR